MRKIGLVTGRMEVARGRNGTRPATGRMASQEMALMTRTETGLGAKEEVSPMNLDELSATFNLSEILDTTVGLFPDFVEIAKGGTFVGGVEFSPYEFYSDQEDRIFDHRKLQKDRMMKNFFEAIEIMSWAVYRVWSRELKLANKEQRERIFPGFS